MRVKRERGAFKTLNKSAAVPATVGGELSKQKPLAAGEEVLANGGTSLDAVVAAITIMEDSPLFPAMAAECDEKKCLMQSKLAHPESLA